MSYHQFTKRIVGHHFNVNVRFSPRSIGLGGNLTFWRGQDSDYPGYGGSLDFYLPFIDVYITMERHLTPRKEKK